MTEYIKKEEALRVLSFIGTDMLVEAIPITLLSARNKIRAIPAEKVIAVPCFVGDTIYVKQGGEFVPKTIEKIELHSNGYITLGFDWRGMGYEHVSACDIGNTVLFDKRGGIEKT